MKAEAYEKAYEIEIAEFNSAGIRAEAKKQGITHMREIGRGYVEGHDGDADWFIRFYALPNPKGWEFRVADTNSDPVWEDVDQQDFADLAESCGVEL